MKGASIMRLGFSLSRLGGLKFPSSATSAAIVASATSISPGAIVAGRARLLGAISGLLQLGAIPLPMVVGATIVTSASLALTRALDA